MKRKNFLTIQERVFFKRWKNKPYAILNTLHKIIIVLSLPIVYLACFHAEMKAQDTVKLNEMYVNAMLTGLNAKDYVPVLTITKEDISESEAGNISDLLATVPLLDIRKRGTGDAQTDISLAGGNFDQVLILINGIPLNDYQTGHNSLNLPVDFSQIERIEILRSPSLAYAGFNAYSGAINIITKNKTEQKLTVNQWFGDYSYLKTAVDGSFRIGQLRNSVAFTNAQSDGYTTDTDFKIRRFYMQNNLSGKNYFLQIQSGLQLKGYGSYGFYTLKFPYQFEALNTSFVSLKLSVQHKKAVSTLKIFTRRNQDRFELFREGENWYHFDGNYYIRCQDTAKYVPNIYQDWAYYTGHNYHLTYNGGAFYSLNFKNFLLSATYNYFFIRSNVLGETADSVPVPFTENAFFTKKAMRQNVALSLNKFFKVTDNYNFTASYSANYNFNTGYFGVFSIENNLKINKLRLYVSANQGFRLPTFTDMYYNGPSNVGNPDLKPEKNTTFTLSAAYSNGIFTTSPQIFYRLGKNSIDWILDTTDNKWHSVNYTQLNTFGIQLPLIFDFSKKNIFIKNVKLTGAYLRQSKVDTNIISKYSLDYVPYSFDVSATFMPVKHLYININYLYKKRLGTVDLQGIESITSMPYPDYHLLNAKISFRIKKYSIFIEGTNLLNKKMYDYFTKLPGRWIMAGFKIEL